MDDDSPATDPELTRLADGSLPAASRASLRARAESSPELAEQLREQARAVSLMRSTDGIGAPASLRAAVAELTTPNRGGRRRTWGRLNLAGWHPRVFVPAATAFAVLVALIVIVTGGSSAPTVDQTAHAALAAALTPAPAVDAADHDLLTTRAGGIPFPSYVESVGWRASGTRSDTLSGRQVTTVFYRNPQGSRIGYAIVSGSALTPPTGRAFTAGGIHYVLTATGSAKLITWRRDGHTCVITGRGVSDRTLVTLATADAAVETA